MTQERYFVVSETELEKFAQAVANTVATSEMGTTRQVEEAEKMEKKAKAACRAREVEYVATISHGGRAIWGEK